MRLLLGHLRLVDVELALDGLTHVVVLRLVGGRDALLRLLVGRLILRVGLDGLAVGSFLVDDLLGGLVDAIDELAGAVHGISAALVLLPERGRRHNEDGAGGRKAHHGEAGPHCPTVTFSDFPDSRPHSSTAVTT